MRCFRLIRGIHTLILPHWSYIKTSWAGPYIRRALGSETAVDGIRDRPRHSQAAILRSLAMGMEVSEQRHSCLKAVDHLFRAIQARHDTRDVTTSATLVQGWVISLDRVFESLLEECRPVPLIILAHFAVLLAMCRELWWTQRWPKTILTFVQDRLSDTWTEWIAWPEEMVSAYLP